MNRPASPLPLSAKPLVCVSASVVVIENGRYPTHATGAKNIDAVERFTGCTPVMLPPLGDRLDAECFVERIDGLVLTGGRANVEPHHYDGPPFPDDEPIDPERDATTLSMVRACVAAGVPVFGICRGIQEMNVALGGSLHYRLHLLEDKDDHRMPRRDDVTAEEIFRPRHPVRLTRGGSFERLAGAPEVMVNSLHGQGIDRLADSLEIEAFSPDGVIEGVRLRDDRTFTAGVQWHAEWKPEEHALSRRLFEEFGHAARARARSRRDPKASGPPASRPRRRSARRLASHLKQAPGIARGRQRIRRPPRPRDFDHRPPDTLMAWTIRQDLTTRPPTAGRAPPSQPACVGRHQERAPGVSGAVPKQARPDRAIVETARPGPSSRKETAGARTTPAGCHSKQDGGSVKLNKRCPCEEHVTIVEGDA